MKFFLRKSPKSRLINRFYYKIDELLSYTGGLFGLIFILINFPLYYYNLLCF